ncbi:MAG: hypothetical protein AAB592_02120 [Patescibacteria group bacterium]
MSVFIEEHRKVFIIGLVIVLITFSFFMLFIGGEAGGASALDTRQIQNNVLTPMELFDAR